jgi:hypothetical protein
MSNRNLTENTVYKNTAQNAVKTRHMPTGGLVNMEINVTLRNEGIIY